MHFVYAPEGADPQKWPFDPTRLMSPEVETIERHTGMSFGQWLEAVTSSSMLALHGLLYVLLKRTNPTLKWDQVQFCMADLDFELDPDEEAELVKTLSDKEAGGIATGPELAALEAYRAKGVEPSDEPPVGKD
jgi:hypothetical protein